MITCSNCRKGTFLLSAAIVCLILCSCVHTEEDFVVATSVPPQICDEDIVYFEQEVFPVLLANCTNSGCHDGETQARGIQLTSYTDLMESDIINLNTPSHSLLYQVLSEENRNQGEDVLTEMQMPPEPYVPLSEAKQESILAWISQGAKNTSCDQACDTLEVGYTSTIKPLITTSCLSCHLPPEPAAGLDFTQYQVIKDMALHGGFINNPRVTTCDSIQFELWIAKGTPND